MTALNLTQEQKQNLAAQENFAAQETKLRTDVFAKNNDWIADIADMHTKFGVNPVINTLEPEKLQTFLQFRIDFLQEELDEMIKAKSEGGPKAADDIVDALIDLCVVAIGTLNAFEVDAAEAWNRVHEKNMQKHAGVNKNRPNPLGLPDLIKPAGWTPPTHADNIGLLSRIF
jgi:predicted HAD superfamily Cof-like phosphohydrolase